MINIKNNKIIVLLISSLFIFSSISPLMAINNTAILDDDTETTLDRDDYEIDDKVTINEKEYKITNKTVTEPKKTGYENGTEIIGTEKKIESYELLVRDGFPIGISYAIYDYLEEEEKYELLGYSGDILKYELLGYRNEILDLNKTGYYGEIKYINYEIKYNIYGNPYMQVDFWTWYDYPVFDDGIYWAVLLLIFYGDYIEYPVYEQIEIWSERVTTFWLQEILNNPLSDDDSVIPEPLDINVTGNDADLIDDPVNNNTSDDIILPNNDNNTSSDEQIDNDAVIPISNTLNPSENSANSDDDGVFASASMKNTALPILAILLVLLSLVGIRSRK